MMNVKKIIGVIISIAVTFTGGFFTGSFNSTGEIKNLENRTREFESKFDAQTERADNLEAGLRKSNISIGNAIETIRGLKESNRILIDTNNRLKTENKRFTETVGNISTGIEEDKNRISGIIEGMDYYIKQAEKTD